ncbi:MAG: hypothetical protein JHD15_07180 [Phenylobacterium sp.]|uniref:hypothetical protein n=1 Tax=Phenylobacterium sp. TaxID=1871053 RepID=UPI001A1B49D0|nr:hypothetical protein [Phenylobacterium sp.]MBJ7410136.1 hypothetical protein [Phenylobacterium sp.]
MLRWFLLSALIMVTACNKPDEVKLTAGEFGGDRSPAGERSGPERGEAGGGRGGDKEKATVDFKATRDGGFDKIVRDKDGTAIDHYDAQGNRIGGVKAADPNYKP